MLKPLRRLLGAALACALVSCGGGDAKPDRWFGYYLTGEGQIAATADHVGLVHEGDWIGVDQTIASMKAHGKPTMLTLTEAAYGYSNKAPRGDLEARIADTFQRLQSAGVLRQVVALYPMDEPELNGIDESEVAEANARIRKVAAQFPELANVKLAVIYSKHGTPGFASYDWIGLDDYQLREGVLKSPAWKSLMDRLRPDQRAILVPGGGDPFRQDPAEFLRYAQSEPRVIGILAFTWLTRIDDPAGPHQGIGTNGMAEAYRAVGREISNQP